LQIFKINIDFLVFNIVFSAFLHCLMGQLLGLCGTGLACGPLIESPCHTLWIHYWAFSYRLLLYAENRYM